MWAIARIYRQSGDVVALGDTYDKWRRLYGKDPGNEDDYVFSFYDVSKLWQKKGRTRQADAAGKATIDAWKAKGSIKGSQGAKWAGEWELAFAERYFDKTFEPYQIKIKARTPAQFKAAKAALEKVTTTTQDKYLALDQYGVAEYSMAAKVRFGETASEYTQKLAAAPTPKFVEDLDRRNPDAGAIAA